MVVGVPEMIPVFVLMNTPGGDVLGGIENVYGVVPPATEMVCEYGAPAVPWGSGEAVLNTSAGVTSSGKLPVARFPLESVTDTSML